MRFLKILFWLVVAVVVTMFAMQNWRNVTIDLWGNLQADIKIPVLLLLAFLIGFLPVWMIYRTRLWRLNNKVSLPHQQPPKADETESAE